eukprot:1327391-Pleurochrysis_carterae.AAC.1
MTPGQRGHKSGQLGQKMVCILTNQPTYVSIICPLRCRDLQWFLYLDFLEYFIFVTFGVSEFARGGHHRVIRPRDRPGLARIAYPPRRSELGS